MSPLAGGRLLQCAIDSCSVTLAFQSVTCVYGSGNESRGPFAYSFLFDLFGLPLRHCAMPPAADNRTAMRSDVIQYYSWI